MIMELFAPILGMTMIVLGMVGLIACVSGLLYVRFFRNDSRPATEQSGPSGVADNQSVAREP